MINARASWSIKVDQEELHERGKVIAYERGGMPATWSVLVLSDSGKLRSPHFEKLVIGDEDTAEARGRGEVAINEIEYLGTLLDEQYGPGDRTPIDRALWLLAHGREVVAELSTTLSKLSSAEHTIQAMTELDATRQRELEALSAQLASNAEQIAQVKKLTAERDGLIGQVKALTKKLAKKGPATGDETT